MHDPVLIYQMFFIQIPRSDPGFQFFISTHTFLTKLSTVRKLILFSTWRFECGL